MSKMNNQELDKLHEKVSNYWDLGNNCAQSTASGILNYYQYDSEAEVLFKSLIPYESGFKEGTVCGAVSGTLAALSFVLTSKNADKEEVTTISKEFKDNFIEKCNSIYCYKILERFKQEDNSINWADPERHPTCTKCVKIAAELGAKLIGKKKLIF